MTSPPVALDISGLSKNFGGTRALFNVDLKIKAGEAHALLGQNGSGKSTLIKLLAGVYQPDGDPIASVFGKPLKIGDPHAAAERGLHFVHQDLGLVPTLDTVDNFALVAGYVRGRFGHVRWREQRRRTQEALRELGYDFDARRPVHELAPSERTAIAIARSMAIGTAGMSVLVLDEPTASLSSAEAERVYEIVRRVRSAGAAVLYVSHHVDEVLAVADCVTVLRDGHKIATETTNGMTSAHLVKLIVGDVDPDADLRTESRCLGSSVLSVEVVGGRVVAGLSFDVRAGEIVGFAGITGSGRGEIGSLLFGGLARTGSVRIDGKSLPPERPDLSVDAGLGYVPADRLARALIHEMNVRENVTIARLGEYCSKLRIRRPAEHSDVEHWLARLSVVPRDTEASIDTLSGGNQQRVVLARWLKLRPRVLILDDPTQGVDVKAKGDIHHLLRTATNEGAAIVISSSDEDELALLCDRVFVLAKGQVVGELEGDAISAPTISQLTLAG